MNFTQTVGIICTSLLTLGESSDRDLQLCLMLRVSTQISVLASETLELVTTMRSRMETWWQEDLCAQETKTLLRQIRGQQSSWLRLERSFTYYFDAINRGLCAQASCPLRSLPSGTFGWIQSHINMTAHFAAMSRDTHNWANGYPSIYDPRLSQHPVSPVSPNGLPRPEEYLDWGVLKV